MLSSFFINLCRHQRAQPCQDAGLGLIYLIDGHSQGFGCLRRAARLADVRRENLPISSRKLHLDRLHGTRDVVLTPISLPDFVGALLGGSGGVYIFNAISGPVLTKSLKNCPLHDALEEGPKTRAGWIVLKLCQGFRQPDQDFLHDVVRVGRLKTVPQRHRANQPAIAMQKLAPSLGTVPGLKSAQKCNVRRDLCRHDASIGNTTTRKKNNFFTGVLSERGVGRN